MAGGLSLSRRPDSARCHEKWKNYLSTITHTYHHFSTKTLHSHQADLPWMTPRIKTLVEKIERAFYIDQVRYRALRNEVIWEIIMAKKSYYPHKLHPEGTNISRWFSKIRQPVASPPLPFFLQSPPPPFEVSEEIYFYFSSICQCLPPSP